MDICFPGEQVILWDLWDVIRRLCDVTKKTRGFKNVMARMQKDKPEQLFMLASLLIGLKMSQIGLARFVPTFLPHPEMICQRCGPWLAAGCKNALGSNFKK